MECLEANACIAAVSTSYVAVPPEATPSTSPSANTPEISKPTRLYCYFGPIQMLIEDELHLVSSLSPGRGLSLRGSPSMLCEDGNRVTVHGEPALVLVILHQTF
jgi:hypothetical protein